MNGLFRFYISPHNPLLMLDGRGRPQLSIRPNSDITVVIGTRRGQITPRLILGTIVLVVIASPLAAVALDIQESFASTPAFSWFWAWVIALLIVAAVVAAVLGLD